MGMLAVLAFKEQERKHSLSSRISNYKPRTIHYQGQKLYSHMNKVYPDFILKASWVMSYLVEANINAFQMYTFKIQI